METKNLKEKDLLINNNLEINSLKENDLLEKNKYNGFEENYNNLNKVDLSKENNYSLKEDKKTIEVMTDGESYFITFNQAIEYGLVEEKEKLEKYDRVYYYLKKSELDYLRHIYIVKLVLVISSDKKNDINLGGYGKKSDGGEEGSLGQAIRVR